MEDKAKTPCQVYENEFLQFLKMPFKGGIRFYQVALGKSKFSTCPMEPSCSNFALDALNTDPLPVAILKIGDRLHRCGHDLEYYPTLIMGQQIKFLDPADKEPSYNSTQQFPTVGEGE